MRKLLPAFLFFSVVVLVGYSLFLHVKNASAQDNSHVVISQIQVGGGGADDEFVELYNPTASAVDLSGWRLRRERSTGSTPSANLVVSLSGIVSPRGYFLITSPESLASQSADKIYTSGDRLASNNTVLLFSDSGLTLVDKVGIGQAVDYETQAAEEPVPGGSIERKINDTGGHGLDTDDNDSDFELLSVSDPRNSLIVITPSPTSTITAEPTQEPSPTPIPSVEPSPSPKSEPSLSPSPTPAPKIIFSTRRTVCVLSYRSIKFFYLWIFVPVVSCSRI